MPEIGRLYPQDVPAPRVGSAMPDQISNLGAVAALLEKLEPATRLDARVVEEQLPDMLSAVAACGDERLLRRAQLVDADVQMRRGDAVAGSKLAESVLAWAQEQHDGYVHARALRVLAGLYYRMGDDVRGLKAAVECVRLLPADADLRVAVDHRLCVADALANGAHVEAANAEYSAALRAARRLGDLDWVLVTLNNYVYTLAMDSDDAQTDAVLAELLSVADRDDVPVDPCYLETMANVQIRRNLHVSARYLLQPVVEQGLSVWRADPYGYSTCLLAYAECCRVMGDLGATEVALAGLRELTQEFAHLLPERLILLERAEFHAATGDFESAYYCQRRAHELNEQVRAEERDVRSRLLHDVYLTDETMAQSDESRRLSLIDPLTGLGNGRYVSETLNERMAVADGRVLAVAIVEIDRFEALRQSCRAEMTDQVLTTTASLLARGINMPMLDAELADIDAALDSPDMAYAARLGHSQFVLVFRAREAAYAEGLVAQQVCAVKEQVAANVPQVGQITASAGLVLCTGLCDVAAVLHRAQDLADQARAQGGDRVLAAELDTQWCVSGVAEQ